METAQKVPLLNFLQQTARILKDRVELPPHSKLV
jgi:hypothetical protein